MWLGLCRNVLILAVFSRYVTLESALANEEEACSSDTFRCKEAISPGSYCIPKNWECDSDADCPGGEDEHEDCSIPTCPTNQFQCKLGAARCVPNGWLCDGEHDCDDGSDELHETCSFVDTFECLPNQYRCPGTRTCIHYDQVCDGITDCFEDRADEGSHCRNTGCKNLLLDNKKCLLCRETLQGAQCYCDDHHVFDTNLSICVDINECKYNEYCDQVCENHDGGYDCNCVQGYSKNGKGSCLADNRESAKIIFANHDNIQLYNLNGRNLAEPQFVNGSQIETLDFDMKNNSICWVNFVKSTESNLKCADLSNPSKTWQVSTHHKLTSVSHVARDWIGNNWYFADDVKENIFLCSGDGVHCVNIITINIKRPKSLALDPTRGLLFFADWSMNAKIERTNMDGSDRQELVVKKIVHPNGLALDYVNKHVYWGDSFLDYIERVDYDGQNRRVIAVGENVDHVFGLTLFENYLYVSNHHNNSIVRVHRFQHDNMTVINKQTLTKPSDIHIIHPVKQPQLSEDVCGKKKCDHICVPVPHSDNDNVVASCMCRSGYTLMNGNNCQKNKDSIFLLYANAQQGNIQGISKDDEKSKQVIEPIINLNRPMAIAYDNKTSYIYYSDVSLLHIGRRKAFTTDEEPEKFLDTGVTSSEGLAIDWIGRNLYWTDDGHKTINIVRLSDTTKRFTVIRELNHPKAIVLDANKGYMYWTDWVLKPSENIKSRIVKAEMNGKNNQTLVETNIQWPNSLTLDYTTQMIYWTDAYYDRIEKISANGDPSTRMVIVSFKNLNHPYGIAVFEDFVFFTESLSGQVKRFNVVTNKTVVIRDDSNPLFDLQLYNPQQQTIEGEKECSVNNGGCTDICVTLPTGFVCICSDDRLLQSDTKTCQANPNYEPPAPCNKDREFTCKDESCINILWKCDGERDCLDGSDEDHSQGGTCDVPCHTFQCHKSENKPCLKEEHLRCDGEKDCPKGEDEESCGSKSRDCQANYTSCGSTSNRCIPSAWVCDKEADCVDGSDEDPAKCDTAKCVADQFQCAYGHCIPYMYRCDNEYDCPDHSDELDCTNWCDPIQEFSCVDKTRCIKKNLVCDGEKHCTDGSDELHCNITKKVCHDKEFQCQNGECITQVWKCDGDFDCSDESDEDKNMCGQTRSCFTTEFKCTSNSQCIPGAWKCDGDKDCGDGSDEDTSQCALKCSYPNFKCVVENSEVCLPPTKYCNDIIDCTDHTDEPRSLCALPVCQGHECSHFCHPAPAVNGGTYRSYVCFCLENQHIGSDNKTCQKTDVCSQWGICSQQCIADINKQNGYRCICKDGYTLQPDGYSCKPNIQPVHIIYSNRHEMRRVDLGEKSYVSLVAGLRNTIAMDYHYKKQYIFWTDVIDDKIYRGKMIQNISELTVPPKALTNIKAIVNVGLATTEGLAVDWISDKIYWVESNLDQIEVAEFNGSNRRTLIAGNMTSPRAIVLDPRYGALFWSDWDGRFPRIEKCSMSGKGRKVLFDVRSNFDLGGWPNGMTLDYEVNRIYWVDARSDSLHSMTYEGKDHRLILKSHDYLAQPFSVSVFEHYVYWTDWRSNSVLRANKFNGSDVTEIQKTFTQPFDIQVFHPNRQPDAFNPCEVNNGGCSHLCLIGFPDESGKTVAECQCPHRMKLKPDKKSCDEDNKFLIFVKKNEIRGVDLQHANYNVIPSITVRFVENSTSTATAIDYDLKEQRLYWTDEARNVINSASLNGSGVETVIDSGLSNPKGFAIDYLSRNMYFSSYNKDKDSSTISVAKLNGAFRTEIISQNLKQLNSLAIHPGKGLMFWSDIGEHKIIKANMDGSDQIILVDNISKPASLTVDTKSHALYWINQGKSTIHKCPLDLAQCEKLNVSFDDNLLVSMTIFEDEIYVYSSDKKNKSANSIVRIDKSFKKVVMRTNTPDISAIQIYNTERGKDGSNGCSDDNGGCSQLCLPTKTDKICKCTAGFKLAADLKSCQGITSFMLYSTESDIQGFTLDDPYQVALASISKISLASAIDFHADDDYIYWVDSNARAISRIKRNLTQREEIINEGLNSIEGLAVDWVANHIYWTDRSHNTVEVAKTDGSNRYVLIHEGLDNPTSIVVHPRNGMLYFIDQGKYPVIMQAKLDGSDLKPLINDDIIRPRGLTIDYDDDVLYWCDQEADKIDKIISYHFNNQNRLEHLVPGLTDCASLTIFKDYIYWADTTDGNGSIKKMNKTFVGDVQYLRQNLTNNLKYVQIFDSARQKVSGHNVCLRNKYNCAELCLYQGSGHASCICSYGRLKPNGRDCEAYTEFLMFSKVTGIESVSMSRTPNKNPPFKPISNETMQNVIGLAYDYKGSRLFFSDIQRGDIQSVFFNGTDLQTVKEGIGSAEGLVFDAKNNNLYFTSYTKSSINRIDFDSDKQELEILIQLSEKDHPRAIVLHACQSRIFWTNWNNENPRIQRSFLDGFGVESIITERIETPNGLAIDNRAEKLYWSDARLDKIERCNLDGSDRVVIVTSIPQHAFGLSVYGDYMYWTDWMLRAVLRANKYDGSDITWLVKNIERQPMGIIAVAEDADNCTLSPCFNNTYGCEGDCVINNKGLPECQCPPGKFLLPDHRRCATEKNLNCNITDYVCEDGRMCIPIDKTCNGITDCVDASDESEEYCKTRKCPADYYSCNNSRCIYLDKICNGINDCGDNTDEKQCPCGHDEFQCDNGMCISNKYRCDRDDDCPDFSDEKHCNLSCTDVEMDGHKVHDLIPCKKTSACIFEIWKCDGTNDCWDNSDEENCNNTNRPSDCPPNSFNCTSGVCIPMQWKCDKDFDCADLSDEADCKYTCSENEQFACADSTCLPKTWQCDGHPDCPDGSDEVGCDKRKCKGEEFMCNSTGKCIPEAWVCDGDTDCQNDEDEPSNCTNVLCEDTEFQCLNRKCIPHTFFCDRDDDCGDNSDEAHCLYPACKPDQFKCVERGLCIDKADRCNGLYDCPDHSDEMNCTVASPCGGDKNKHLCSNGICVDDSKVCDGRNDCGDYSDEPPNCGVNECEENHLCNHQCIDKKIGYECGCKPGYILRADDRTCQDVNECNTTFPCTHYCHNTVGSFHCSCATGYTLSNHRNCKTSVPAELILSNRYYIRNVSLPWGNTSILKDTSVNAVALDVDYKTNYIYWSDISSRSSSINRMRKNDTKGIIEVLHKTTVRNPDGIAVDWVGNNLYWCDKTTDSIEVSQLNGKYRRILVRDGLQEPRGLEVFPAKGVLFYTDWGDKHHIGRVWMDGSKHETIIKDNLGWPNALTIDYVTEKIIWADGSLDYIAMANLDGSGRRIVVSESQRVPHIFDLATFENFIYWTDWEHMGIFYANKFTGANVSQLMSFVHKPMGLQIFHPLKQVQLETDPCEKKGCSHLCLLRPRKGDLDDLESVCSCPENFHLSKDNRQCISNCTSAQFLCKESSKCIPSWWKCDGHIDCDDGSDEPNNCTTYHCLRTGFYQCKSATSSDDCIPPGLICNGVKDCTDGSDEVDCKSFPCLDHHFKCRADDKCIPEFQKCDGNKTCSDGEDEKDCPMRTCSANQFQCNNGLCVPYVWKCDKDDDCGDSSDEPHNCTVLPCKDKHIKCNTSGRCIPEAWQCDGDRDCDDKSDEDSELCHKRTCDPTYFACSNGHCIPGRWKCDGYDDCRDNSDEIDCDPRNCSESEWQCNIGKCIHKKLRCNKEINCEDGSDEVDCENITCDDDEFTCKNIKHCIPVGWQCDGDTDCADGTDEWNCNRTCTEHEYKCNNSICLSALWRCDGDNDCGDNSDETDCENYTCTPGRFRCKQDHICIWNNMFCDGKADCSNGADEDPRVCGDQSCKPGDFRCHAIKGNATNQCISADKVCDNHPDCKDGSDELEKFCNSATCQIRNGGCEQKCEQIYSRLVCSCNDGYQLRKDGKHCMRFDPCKEFGICSQLCESNDFKPKCSCDKGFLEVANSCIADGEPPNLLIAEEGKVISTPLQLNTSKLTVLNTQPQISNHIIAMDVDVSRKDWLAFTVVLSKNHTWIVNSMKIPKGQITSKPNSKRPKRDTSNILFTSFADIRGLTADWIGEHIYWTEGTTHSIKVAKYDGKQANTIVSSNLEDPQDIVVHPKDKQLFWSDLGLRPKIERSNLDGSNRTVIVSEDLSWPNGLAVDYYNDRLYWADTKKYTIESVDLNGDDRRVIHKLNASDPPYKLEVFENFIYVLTYKNFDVLRMHKFGKPDQVLKKMYGSSDKIQAVVILQENKQKKFNDTCVTANTCVETQMCFNDWSEKGHSCKCPDNSKLEDKKCSFQKEKDTCVSSYCKNNGTCSKNVHNKLKCDCPPLFDGEWCEKDKCHNLCIIGKCVESKKFKNGVECICDEGYKGERCEKYKCTDYCKNDGICSIKDDKPYCFCSSQYSGERCENTTSENVGCEHCVNGATCHTEASGYIRCQCQPGFTGVHCGQCIDLHCYNDGVCHYDANNTAYCSCKHGYNTPNCHKSIDNCDEICQSTTLDKGNCNCPCEGIECLCQHYECNTGNCTVENNKAKCECDEIYEGRNCERCICFNGECLKVDNLAVCRCNEGFTGKFCENKDVSQSRSGSLLSNPLNIVIPILVSFIIVILVIVFIICRRRKRWQQYRHKRMQEPRNLDVNNPIYLQNDEEVEDIEPLESSPIYTGNKNTNFANPMYDIHNTESMSMLLQSRGDTEDNNIIDEGGLSVSYYRNGEVNLNNNTTSKA